jgi:hypothetical protein
MNLLFSVDKQIITRTDKEKVVRDSMNYLHANFTFSEEWTGQITAVFKSKSGAFNVLLDNLNSCLVPWEVLKDEVIEISVFCRDLITANKAKIITIESGYEIGEEGRIPTPDIYTQIIDMINNIETGTVDPEVVAEVVDEYLADKDFVTEDDVNNIVAAYFDAHKVEVTQILSSGTKIAEIEVDGETTELFAPAGGSGADSTSCEFVNESQYVACVGAQFNIYFDNICKTHNNANIYFGVSSSNSNIPVTVYEERMSITPVAANVGTSTITVKARRKDTGAEIASTTFTLRVVAKTALSRNVRVMLIGDSITNGGWNYNLPNMMDVTFYGTLGTSPRNHEGRVSWKAVDYCTKESYNNYTNPFYNPNKSGSIKFDFAYYMANHPSFANVDYVNIMLGRNDGYTSECVQYIKAMVDDILSYNNNVRVTVSFGYQKGYQLWDKDKPYTTYGARTPIFDFDAMLHEEFDEYTRVDLIPTFINSDNIYDHGTTGVHVSTRNTVFSYPVYVQDGTHFITQGYYKIGDVYYNYLNYLTGLYPLPVDPTVVDKTTLLADINSANTLKNNTSVSVDGTDIPSSDYWVTQAVYDTFANAITTAQGVYDDTDATQTEVDDAASALEGATTTFSAARQNGSAEPSIVYPMSNPKYFWCVHNKTKDTYYFVGWAWGPDAYYPTAATITKNAGLGKVFITFTMSGTASSYQWRDYTSSDGVTWSSATNHNNSNQWEITSAIGINDTYETIEKVMHT